MKEKCLQSSIFLPKKCLKEPSIHRVIERAENESGHKRGVGSGRQSKIMTSKNVKSLVNMFEHVLNKCGVSQRQTARKFNCSQAYINKTPKKKSKIRLDGQYLFWPDLASAHYPKKVILFLNENNINFFKRKIIPRIFQSVDQLKTFGVFSKVLYTRTNGKQKINFTN